MFALESRSRLGCCVALVCSCQMPGDLRRVLHVQHGCCGTDPGDRSNFHHRARLSRQQKVRSEPERFWAFPQENSLPGQAREANRTRTLFKTPWRATIAEGCFPQPAPNPLQLRSCPRKRGVRRPPACNTRSTAASLPSVRGTRPLSVRNPRDRWRPVPRGTGARPPALNSDHDVPFH
jgi:hypothetical protein